MSFVALTCAALFQLAPVCDQSASDPQQSIASSTFGAPERDETLAAERGTGLEQVGLSQENGASRVRQVSIALNDLRTSQEARDLTDNWNVMIALPLIAEATLQANR